MSTSNDKTMGEKLTDMKDAAVENATYAGEKVREMFTGEKPESEKTAADKVKETGESVVNTTTDKTSEAMEQTKDTAEGAAQAAKEKGEELQETAREKIHEATSESK